MNPLLKRCLAAGLVIFVTSACKDVPLLPHWDSSWNVPLPSQALVIPTGIPIPSGLSAPASFQTQDALDKSVGQLLSNAADTGSVILTVSKQASLALSGNFTVDIDSSGAFGASKISIPVSFAATATTVTDTAHANLGMIRAAADNNGTLYIRMNGTVTNPGPGTVTPNSSNDTITVKIAAIATIHVSQ